MIREITITDTKPSVTNCHTMLSHLQKEVFCYHGIDVPYYKLLFSTTLNINDLIEVDDKEFYLRFLEDTFAYMDKYHYEEGMKKVVAEIENLLNNSIIGTVSDKALLLDYKAAMADQTSKAIKLEQQALELITEINADNALLVSNLNANMGALYHKTNKNDLAAYHMEQGISILEKYGLIYMNQSIAQICNYAVLLHDMGESERGLSALRRCAKTVKEHNSELSSDYAAIQEAMGNINLACGRLDKAREHLKKALSIYEQLWSDEPQLIEAKQEEILQQYVAAGLGIGSSFLI